jgi:hypothetical protein
MVSDEALMTALRDGVERRFAEWPPIDLAPGPSGVYTIWMDGVLLYVGMAYAHRSESNPKASGVFGRLQSHASGRRSGDQFCI